MQKATSFITGFVIGVYVHRKIALLFKDSCRIEDCRFRVISNHPEVVIRDMNKHMRDKHPGWIQ